MSYIIRDNQLQTAKPIKNLTDDQKKVLRIGTPKQDVALYETRGSQ
jgi:hypothetical protein